MSTALECAAGDEVVVDWSNQDVVQIVSNEIQQGLSNIWEGSSTPLQYAGQLAAIFISFMKPVTVLEMNVTVEDTTIRVELIPVSGSNILEQVRYN